MDVKEINPSSIPSNVPMISSFTKASFLNSYRRGQPFSFPDSIMFYISKNPKNSKLIQKMIKSCKYFFVQNPFIKILDLNIYFKNEWQTSYDGISVDLKKFPSRIWVTGMMTVENPKEQNDISFIIPQIYQYDAIELCLNDINISYNIFKFLAVKCEIIRFTNVTVKDESGSIVALEKLVKVVSNVKEFHYDLGNNGSKIITSKTVNALLKIPHFSQIELFSLENVPEKNKKTLIQLKFEDSVSVEYQNRLQIIVDEIYRKKKPKYQEPYIGFPGMN
uniref:Uncharacterized protein n=1 Tax=Panagrolaimus sp. ES5 TaxID=591445 RepID=A0AC34GPX4_9BILA